MFCEHRKLFSGSARLKTFALQVTDNRRHHVWLPSCQWRSSTSGASVSVPCVTCPSQVHAEAGLDKQAFVQCSGSHRGLHMESGASPSGSRKGFIDKTRVISVYDSALGKETKRITLYSPFSYLYNFNINISQIWGGSTLESIENQITTASPSTLR